MKTMLFSDRMRQVFTPGPTGFIGAVDQLIDVAKDWDLRLDWFDIEKGLCRIEASRGGEIHETFETVLDKGVFRAMLSRLAALCGNSVSPYGGEGTFIAGELVTLTISLMNTKVDHWATIHVER